MGGRIASSSSGRVRIAIDKYLGKGYNSYIDAL